ncbi:MAG: hypothetical protein K6E20_01725 [Acholeplasmatales bacterium]|nr:hypothetical protein [Acholeplasmatales bacterium]
MKTINLTERQVIVLKSLLVQEIDYLENEAIPDAIEQDKKDLQGELEACKDLLEQLNK